MGMKGLEPVADVSAGDWIADALPGLHGTVASVVPRGFAAYARVLHPMESHDGDVRVGSLAPPALSALIDVLAPATGEQDCFHALWEGWGWVDGLGVRLFSVRDDGRVMPEPVPSPGVSPEVWVLPRLRLPGRDYLLFRGPLQAALHMGWQATAEWFQPQSPSLLWPADHSWCVGTEIDFDSTLVGGSAGLISAVLAAPGLDTWPVGPDDDLTAFTEPPHPLS
jgi:hypothetical protein